MTPEMARRIEFLREKAAEGYGSRWLAGELGLSIRWIEEICRNNGIKLRNWQATNTLQSLARLGIHKGQMNFGRTASAVECEDFLPDVGEV